MGYSDCQESLSLVPSVLISELVEISSFPETGHNIGSLNAYSIYKEKDQSVTRQIIDDDSFSVKAKAGQCATIATNFTNHKMLTAMSQKEQTTEAPKAKNEVAMNIENKRKAAFSDTIEETTVTADNSCNTLNCRCLHNSIWWMRWLLLVLLCKEVQGNAIRDEARNCYISDTEGTSIGDIDGEMVCHIPELMSERCKSQQDATCPTSDYKFNLLTNVSCMYSCKNGEKIVCFDTDDGIHFICLPKDIRCPEGLGWNVSFKRSTGMVDIRLEECPLGWYQDKPSKCLDVCKNQHFPKYYIPKGFQLLKEGDNIHPQLFMCNFSSGYYNPQNKSFVKGDLQSLMIMNEFCVNSPNPCSKGQMVLHNGTCVDECMLGYRREAPDFFCRQINDANKGGIVSPEKEENLSTVTSQQQPEQQMPSLTTSPYYMITDLKTASSSNLPEGKEDQGATQMQLRVHPAVTALLVIIAIGVVCICVFLAVQFLRKRKDNKSGHLNENSDASGDSGNQVNVIQDAAPQDPLLSDPNWQNGSGPRNINTRIEVGKIR